MASYDRQHKSPKPTNAFGDPVEPKPGGKGELTEAEFMTGATDKLDRAYRKAAFNSMAGKDSIIGLKELKAGLPKILSRAEYQKYVTTMDALRQTDASSEKAAASLAAKLAAGAKIGPKQQAASLNIFRAASDAAESAFNRPDAMPVKAGVRKAYAEAFRLKSVDMESHAALGSEIASRMLGNAGRLAIEDRIERYLQASTTTRTASDYAQTKHQMTELAMHRAATDVLRGLRADTGASWNQFASEILKGKNLKAYAEWGFNNSALGG
jgi:hypothetical protein